MRRATCATASTTTARYEVDRPWGKLTRFRLFDLEFEHVEGLSARLPGRPRADPEGVLPRARRTSRARGAPTGCSCCTGPNGSAKSTFAACLMRALEHYSKQPRGRALPLLLGVPARHRRQDDRLRLARRGPDAGRDLRAPTRGAPRREAAQPDPRAPAVAVPAGTSAPSWCSAPTRPCAHRRGGAALDHARPARPEEPPDLRGAADRLPRRSGARARARAGRALHDLAPLPHRRRHHRPADGGRRVSERQITADTSLAALPASLSSLTLVRAVRRAGRRLRRPDRVQRPAQAPARRLEVPAARRSRPARCRCRSPRCRSTP